MVFAKLVKSIKDIVDPAALLSLAGHALPLRHRYVLTRHNRLRLRYVASPLALVALVALTALHSGAPDISSAYDVAALTPAAGVAQAEIPPVETAAADSVKTEDGIFMGRYAAMARRMQRSAQYDHTEEETVAQNNNEAAAPSDPAAPRRRTVEVGKGDTLAGVLKKAGVSSAEAFNAVEAMKKHYDPRNLRPGQTMALDFNPDENDEDGYILAGLSMDIDPLRTVNLARTDEGAYEAAMKEKATVHKMVARKTAIETSLYGSALKAGIPSAIVAEAIRVYSYDVDFQRDLRRGDSVDVMYEQYETEDGAPVRTGNIVYARLNINGRDMPIYRYESKSGIVDYYTADGTSIRKTLMSTPVDGARISSGYGMREHPVLGYTKMHKGVDFAAPRGTPIYAAGDGTIMKAGPFSSFGNYVRIRHNSSIDTAYGHMQGFAKGIQAGTRVKQGQVIGYIGTTGRSTGPHLHYEVLMNGAQVNPRSLKLPVGELLKGQQLQAFKAYARDIDRQFAALSGGQFADAEDRAKQAIRYR